TYGKQQIEEHLVVERPTGNQIGPDPARDVRTVMRDEQQRLENVARLDGIQLREVHVDVDRKQHRGGNPVHGHDAHDSTAQKLDRLLCAADRIHDESTDDKEDVDADLAEAKIQERVIEPFLWIACMVEHHQQSSDPTQTLHRLEISHCTSAH